MEKKWKHIIAAAGLGWMLFSGMEVYGFEPYYLNGDQTLSMIQNTGGIYNDGSTGLFMDLSTMEIEDVFSDGLAAKVNVTDISNNEIISVQPIHVRFAEDGRAWVLRNDGKWQEVSEGSEDPASLAVYFVREAMGDDKQRDKFTDEIAKIMAEKQDPPGTIVPEDAIPLETPAPVVKTPVPTPKEAVTPKKQDEKKPDIETKKEANGKPKGKASNPSTPQVTVTITEAPKVEIIEQPEVKVEIE